MTADKESGLTLEKIESAIELLNNQKVPEFFEYLLNQNVYDFYKEQGGAIEKVDENGVNYLQKSGDDDRYYLVGRIK